MIGGRRDGKREEKQNIEEVRSETHHKQVVCGRKGGYRVSDAHHCQALQHIEHHMSDVMVAAAKGM